MRPYNKHYAGERHGNLTLVERIPGGHKWRCRCDCGNEVIAQVSSGHISCQACAAKRIGEKIKTHGKSRNGYRLYRIWDAMRNRCNNPHNSGYRNYGGRGIAVCKEWDDFAVFESWALSNGYAENLTIDRIDNNASYSPKNCVWHTQTQQMKNTRNSHFITIDGKSKCVIDWCFELHLIKSNAYCTAKEVGISVDDYLTFKYFNRSVPCSKSNFEVWKSNHKEGI